MFGLGKLFDDPQPPRQQATYQTPYRPPVVPPEPRIYTAHTYSGEERLHLTLDEARQQVGVWAGQGVPGFVGNSRDPEWEDIRGAGEEELDSAYDHALSFADRNLAITYAKEMLQAVGCEIDHEDGRFVVYDTQEGV